MSDVGLVAQAVTEVAKVIGQWRASAEHRKMSACIEAGEKYIMVNEKTGNYESITDKKQKQLLSHYRKRFFTYN